MKLKLKLATLALSALVATGPALANELVFPSMSYRTGPFAAGGIPFADGYADYFTLLNERDGGIGGVPAKVLECETGYNTEKGVECYESTKGEGALIYQPLSTGITYQLIPKATADGIPIHTMGYGRTSAKNGKVFRNVFNYPVNYWDGASVGINYFKSVSGGSLKGKKITLLYFNGAYGKEPIPTLTKLAEIEGFDFNALPIDYPGQEQKSQWLQIRREKPDFILFWGWGVMNQVAIQEAANIRYPMENFMGIWWSGSENDVLPAGEAANGYKALAFHNVGSDFPVFDDIQKYVVDAGKAAGNGDQIGTVLYNRGVYAAFLAAEAVKTAQAANGTGEINAAMMRDAMEVLDITAVKMDAAGLPNFGPEFTVTCENHGGPGLAAVAQWDAFAKKWSLITDFSPSDSSVINPLIEADSASYAAENNIEPGCS
jgi:branched-chain amino acid transport system substrate-binding protein